MSNPTARTTPIGSDGQYKTSSPSKGTETKTEDSKSEPVFTIDQVKSLIAEQLKVFEASRPNDDTKERMSDLIQKVAEAKAKGEMWIETSAENIQLLQPHGMGKDRSGRPNRFFCWQGVKICERGANPGQTVQEIEEDQSKTMHDRLHPEASKGIVVLSGAI